MRTILLLLTLSLVFSIALSEEKQPQPSSNTPILERFIKWRTYTKQNQEHGQLKPTKSVIFAAVLCFIAASISSAGGIGGGGLFIPILTIVAGLDLKTASAFSAFMVTGGSISNVTFNLCGKPLIDYDLALLLQPCMLLGVSIGVICNKIFPEWIITVLFAIFLAWSTAKTFKSGVLFWRMESDAVMRKESGEMESGLVKDCVEVADGERESVKEPLLSVERKKTEEKIPWMKLAVLILVWFSFFIIYILRGDKYGEGIITIKPCGTEYWFLLSLQIPLAIVFTKWVLWRKERSEGQLLNHQENNSNASIGQTKTLMFPAMALMAGMLGGVFGIGGGMLISPLLLQVGIAPEVTAATCSFMVFFSSSMSAIQYLLTGMQHEEAASIFAIVCFAASVVGLVVVQRAIKKFGRASLIVFSVGAVMALSAILMTSFGAVDVWNDYVSGKYMGFKPPC